MDDLLQATDDKHLIIEDQFEGEPDSARPPLHSDRRYDFWANRYLCIHGIHNEDDEFWRFDIFDLLTYESKSMRFQKSSNRFDYVETYFLDHKFMFFVEIEDRIEGLKCVNLVKLNWESGIFDTLEHFEWKSFLFCIFVDSLDQMKFVLETVTLPGPVLEYQDCKLVNGKIKLGNVHCLSDRYLQCSSDKLIGIYNWGQKLRIKTYNMIDKQKKTFKTKAYPEHVQPVDNISLHKWVVDRLYVSIHFRDSGNYGLMWTDAQTRRWTILDFLANMPIRGSHFFHDTLIIHTKQDGIENGVFKSSVKVYGIAIYRPQSLRQKAWLRVIRNLKAEGNLDPYKEASRYLPLNTDLRPHWFEDVEEAPSKQDVEKSNFDGTNGEFETIQEAKSDQDDGKDGEEAPDKQDDEKDTGE